MPRNVEKVVSRSEAKAISKRARARGKTVVLTNGCFDILHVGHVRYLSQARALGDYLIVGLNSDDSVQQLKGKRRPFVSQDERAELLAALSSVDYVVIFDEPTAMQLVAELQPDIYAKGGDYASDAQSSDKKSLPEAEAVAAYGGKVAILPLQAGHSTTDLIATIAARYGQDLDSASLKQE